LFYSDHNHGICADPNTFCQEKHQHFHVDRQLVTKKETSSKINKRSWPSGLIAGFRRRGAEFGSRRGHDFFLFFAFFFNVTTRMRVFSQINRCQQKKQKTKQKTKKTKKWGLRF